MKAFNTRLSRSLLWPSFVTILALCVAMGVLAWAQLARQDREHGEQMERWLAASLGDAIGAYQQIGSLQRFVVIASDGAPLSRMVVASGSPAIVIASTRRSEIGKPLSAIDDRALAETMILAASSASSGGEQAARGDGALAAPVRLSLVALPEAARAGVVGLRIDTSFLSSVTRPMALGFAGLATLAILAAYGVFLLVVRRRVLRPLRQIVSAVRRRRAGKRSGRIVLRGQDEFTDVAAEIDAAFDAVAAQQAELRKLATIAAGPRSIVMVARPDGVIEWVNDSFTQVTGYPREEAVGRRISDFLSGSSVDRSRMARYWDQLLRGETVETALTYRTRDGRELSIEAEGCPVRDETGHIACLVMLCDDVTAERELRQQLLAATAAVQREVAYDLHDHVGGDLGGLAFRARRLAERLQAEGNVGAEAAAELTQALARVASRTRALSHLLAPTSSELGGIDTALVRLCESARSYAGVRSRLRTAGLPVSLPEWQTEQLYLIAQEAVRNALTHARPTHVAVTLSVRPGRLLVQVTNDQSFWDPATVRQGLGLRAMRYRADALGATLQMRARPRGVTSVRVTLPLAATQAASALPAEQSIRHDMLRKLV